MVLARQLENASPQARRVCSGRVRFAVASFTPMMFAVLRQPRHRLHAHVHHAARRDVVDDDRQIHRVGDGGVMQEQPLLRRLVVIRASPPAPRPRRLPWHGGSGRWLPRCCSIRRRRSPARGLWRPRWRSPPPGGARHAISVGLSPVVPTGTTAMGAFLDLPVDERGIGFLVHGAVLPHGRDQRDERSFENIFPSPGRRLCRAKAGS